jgi:hypothetical protein
LLAIEPAVVEKLDAIDLPSVTGNVEYRHVSHEQLLEKGDRYAKFYAQQFQ